MSACTPAQPQAVQQLAKRVCDILSRLVLERTGPERSFPVRSDGLGFDGELSKGTRGAPGRM